MSNIKERARKRNSIQGAVLALTLIVTLVVGSVPAAQAQGSAPDLFADAAMGADAVQSNPAHVMRSRYVDVNLGLLLNAKGQALDVKASPELSLNLFPDASYIGVIDKVQNNASGGYSWIGRLKGLEEGYFYLVTSDDVFIAHVASPQGVYEVSWAGNGLYRVIQIDQTKLGEDFPREMPEPGPVFTAADLGPAADTGGTIDVMVVYTDDARLAEGGTAAMKARIALAVTETNQSYANDGIIPRLRLVHVQEYSYVETGNIGTDLARLVGTSDTYFTTVHSLRNTYGADMVSLVVENGGGYCGLANAIMATAPGAFQVTQRSGCMTGYYSFGHEFGHLQGARHDTYVDSSTTPFAYGHGHTHPSATAAESWRTVMAYNNACSDFGYNCTRLQWWSNPTKTWLGALMGVVGISENYKVLNATRVTVANFRAQKIGSNFYSPFTTNSTGWAAVAGSWLRSSGYLQTAGVANRWSSVKHTGIYGDLTYQVRLRRTGCTWCSNSLWIRGNPVSLTTYKEWKPVYEFSYTNTGAFAIWRINSAGTATALKGWTASTAIAKGGWNTLKVVAVGSLMRFYINNVLVWSVASSLYPTGQAGVAMYRDGTSTGNRLYIDWVSMANTPTADVRADEFTADSMELPGGDPRGLP